jgi:hypothetical protein
MKNKRIGPKKSSMQEALANGYVSTPGGFRRKSFVHRVRPGESVIKRAGISHVMDMTSMRLIVGPADEKPVESLADQAGGWVTWADWNNQAQDAISTFSTKWTVPPAPTSQSGQLIYLFNGLQDVAGGEILQPVLQWGVSGAGGGNYWSIASWHVDSSGHAFCTPVVQVNVGDVLTGNMTMLAVFADATRNYSCEFLGVPQTKLVALGLTNLVAAEQTLEAYGVTGKSDYPATPLTSMTDIRVQLGSNPAPLVWQTNTMQNPAYGEHTQVVDNSSVGGQVDLYY